MTNTPRWPEGSTARVVHALSVLLAFELLVLLSRLVLVPAVGPISGVLTFVLCYGGVLGYLLMRVGRLGWRDLGYTRAGWRREIVLGAVGAAAISALLLAWIYLCQGADGVDETVARIASFSPMQRLSFIVIGLLAASAEETMFRGYLQPALMARLGAATGLMLTMVLFQIGHYTDWPTLDRVGSLAIIGLGFGVLRWRRRPLLGAFTAHTLVWVIWGNA